MTIAKIKTLRKNFDMKKQKLISTRKKKKKGCKELSYNKQ